MYEGIVVVPTVTSNKKFFRALREFTAIQAVGVSAVRGQPKGTLRQIHEYLGRVRLERLAGMDCTDYMRWLDARTRYLQRKLPGRDKRWGVARKAMNLFMRDCLYNTYVSRKFYLRRVQQYMEIPLDSRVAHGLREDARERGLRLPQWPGLIGLQQEVSREFQEHATDYASREKLPARVFLDNYLWLKYR